VSCRRLPEVRRSAAARATGAFADGRSSHAQVLRALALLRQLRFRHLYAGILCTVDLRNDPIAVYEALRAEAPPRVDLLLAAIHPAQSARFASFRHARATMEAWNDDYAGWPIDDFLRAYLESLMQMHGRLAPSNRGEPLKPSSH